MSLTPYKCSRNIRHYFSVPLIYSLTYATITTTKGKLNTVFTKRITECIIYMIHAREDGQ